MKMAIKRVKHWCPVCDEAILTGTVCTNCQADIGKNKQKIKKPKKVRINIEEEDS